MRDPGTRLGTGEGAPADSGGTVPGLAAEVDTSARNRYIS